MTFVKFSASIFVAISCLTTISVAHAAEFCTLAQAALYKNQSLVALKYQLEASSERVIQSQNINGPKLDLLANLTAYTAQQGSSKITKDGTIALSFSQTIYDHGLSAAILQQARGNDELVKLDLVRNVQQALVDVATLYVQHLQNIQLLALHRSNIAITSEQFSNVQDRYDASQATQQELLLVKSRVRQAMSQMLLAKAQVTLSRVRLLGITNKTPMGNDTRFLDKLLNSLPNSMRNAVDIAYHNSVEIEQTDIAIDIATHAVKVQESAFGPKVNITANLGFGKVGINKGFAGQVGLNLTMPLYSSGVLESRVRESKAMLAAARASRAYMTELSRQNVSASYEVTKNIKQSIAILPEAIEAEEIAIKSLEESLASSLIPVAEILLVKASLFELRKGLINLKFERYLANLSLLSSVGHLKNMNSMKHIGLCN